MNCYQYDRPVWSHAVNHTVQPGILFTCTHIAVCTSWNKQRQNRIGWIIHIQVTMSCLVNKLSI